MARTLIGGYEIEGLIGEGGMGAVYRATHKLLGRKAAIKVLLPQFSQNQDLVQRFFDEARASTQIHHPGIVQIFDFGYHHNDGSAYIVMELLQGEPLDDRLKNGRRLAPVEAKRICTQIASALEVAHDAGIVHRDLKPENVFLVPDPAVEGGERAKLLDFGVAKLTSPGETTKTKTGAVMGTPIYMSPEQCRGVHSVDGRADIYSLACILFQIVCGKVPFDYPSVGELFAAHLGEAPPDATVFGAPPAFAEVITKGMAKSVDQRYQTMSDFAGAVNRADEGGAIAAALLSSADPMQSAMGSASGVDASTEPPANTTLGQAIAVSVAPSPSPRQRQTGRGWPVLVGVGAIAIAAVAFVSVWLAGGSSGDNRPASAENQAEISAAKPADDVETNTEPTQSVEPAGVDPTKIVTLTIATAPNGAEVRNGSETGPVVGRTPLNNFEVEPLTDAEGNKAFWIVLDGYQSVRLTCESGDSLTDALTLEKAVAGDRKKPDTTPPDAKKGRLSRTKIKNAMRPARSIARRCFERALQINPTLSGVVRVRLTVSAAGKPMSIRASGMPAINDCVAKAVRRVRFPKPSGGGTVSVSYPLRFKPNVSSPRPKSGGASGSDTRAKKDPKDDGRSHR